MKLGLINSCRGFRTSYVISFLISIKNPFRHPIKYDTQKLFTFPLNTPFFAARPPYFFFSSTPTRALRWINHHLRQRTTPLPSLRKQSYKRIHGTKTGAHLLAVNLAAHLSSSSPV
jgi:hypothetical protein